ncbi:DUF6236 family protein [Shewanella sp. 0m-8]
MNQRGLMITQSIDANLSGFTFNGGLDEQSLRQYLLFWDYLACPQSNMIHMGMGNDFDYLISAGRAKYLQINDYSISNAGASFWRSLEKRAFDQLLVDQKTDWSIASNIRTLGLSERESSTNDALCFSLIDALKVFTPEVPLPEILEFKARRQDMLLEFRDSMDDLKDFVRMSPDSVEAFQRKQRKIQNDIAELNRLIDEAKHPSVFRCAVDVLTVEGAVGFTSAIISGLGGDLSQTLALKGASVMGGIGVSIVKHNSPVKLPAHLKQYAYVACAKQELL